MKKRSHVGFGATGTPGAGAGGSGGGGGGDGGIGEAHSSSTVNAKEDIVYIKPLNVLEENDHWVDYTSTIIRNKISRGKSVPKVVGFLWNNSLQRRVIISLQDTYIAEGYNRLVELTKGRGQGRTRDFNKVGKPCTQTGSLKITIKASGNFEDLQFRENTPRDPTKSLRPLNLWGILFAELSPKETAGSAIFMCTCHLNGRAVVVVVVVVHA
ncbi:hypothetical protein M0802_005387 [Mischocyttarus mexicanus]|nr:hypothetical protein M0802_005387 [Mischocyttarus mexicanus]